RRGADHPGRGELEPVEEEVGEQEGGEVVDLHDQLMAVRGDAALAGHDPGVVDQDMDVVIPPEELIGEVTDLVERGEVGGYGVRAVFGYRSDTVGHPR